jgi:xeroderma pigmentosum group C-complementing protein
VQNVPQAGGYLTVADDVVEAFHLPKYQHVVAAYSTDSPPRRRGPDKNTDAAQNRMEMSATPLDILHEKQDDIEMEEVTVPLLHERAEPMTMRELADATRQPSVNGSDDLPASQPLTTRGLVNANTKAGAVSNDRTATSSKSTPTARTTPKPRNSARKRARDESEKPALDTKRGKGDSASVSVPTPTRILRPRASKSAAQIQEEREREYAYRRATAE